jgi:glycine cleavage system aminomethyltransferase T
VGRTVGTTYLPAEVLEGTPVEVDVFADRIAATVAPDVLVDPAGDRMRG